MLSRHSLAALAVLAATASAEVATIIGLLPQDVPMVASIAGSDATATTYAISCGSPLPAVDDIEEMCEVLGQMSITQGPKTFGYTTSTVIQEATPPATITASIGCELEGTTRATCVHQVTGLPLDLLPPEFSDLAEQLEAMATPSTTIFEGEYMPSFVTVSLVGGSASSKPTTTADVATDAPSSQASRGPSASGSGSAAPSVRPPSPTTSAPPQATGAASANMGSVALMGAGLAAALGAVFVL